MQVLSTRNSLWLIERVWHDFRGFSFVWWKVTALLYSSSFHNLKKILAKPSTDDRIVLNFSSSKLSKSSVSPRYGNNVCRTYVMRLPLISSGTLSFTFDRTIALPDGQFNINATDETVKMTLGKRCLGRVHWIFDTFNLVKMCGHSFRLHAIHHCLFDPVLFL